MKAVYICDNCRLKEVVAMCREYGCGIEVQSFYDPAYIEGERDAIAKHRELIRDIPGRSLHGPFGDLCAGSFDVMVRDLARYRYQQAFDIASQLEIKQLVLHHGYVPGTSPRSGWIKRYPAFWRELLDDKPDDIRVHLENHLERDVRMFSDVIGAIDDARVDICLDIGHVHCNARQRLTDWIEMLGPQIGYVHLHDNHGQTDEHLGLGFGTIPMDEVCGALEQYAPEAIWAIEAGLDHIPQSLAWLKERGLMQ